MAKDKDGVELNREVKPVAYDPHRLVDKLHRSKLS